MPPPDGQSAATPAPGPLPFEAHKRILDNAYKERDQFKTQLQSLQQQLQSPDTQRLQQWAQAYQANPAQWFESTVAELVSARPDLAQSLRSQAARLLGSRQQPADSMEPDIPVFDETGRQVNTTFSADRVKAIVQHAVNEALQREVSPIKQDYQQRKQQEEFAARQREAQSSATAQYEKAKAWPGFLVKDANGKEVTDPDMVKAFNEHSDWDLRETYINVVVPKLQAREQATVLEHLQTKANASAVNPSGAAVTSPRKVTSFHDKSLTW